MTRPRRILLSTFGSAGDLFPLIPAIVGLRDRGDEVVVATGRGTGLYLRAAGIPTVALGDGSELRVVRDERIFSTRFNGWESWRQTLTSYVAATLRSDIERMRAMIREWAPDLVVCCSFAVATRIAARQCGLTPMEISIYPQHIALTQAGTRFARSFASLAEEVAGPDLAAEDPASWLWGVPADVMLHDRALLGAACPELAPIGFPYWDGIPGMADDETSVEGYLGGTTPTVVVTLGSFIGVAVESAWRSAADAVQSCGVRAVFVGARGTFADEEFADRDDILRVGFVPLSRYLHRADVIVHHGGIGTTFGAIRAGVPSVVLPQAFDQAFNARLITAANLGSQASPSTLIEHLARALDGRFSDSTRAVGATLASTSSATARMIDHMDRSIGTAR